MIVQQENTHLNLANNFSNESDSWCGFQDSQIPWKKKPAHDKLKIFEKSTKANGINSRQCGECWHRALWNKYSHMEGEREFR